MYITYKKYTEKCLQIDSGKDYTSSEYALRQLNLVSFKKGVFIKKAKVIFKVTQRISPIYITEMFQIKSCNSEDTMSLRSNSNKNIIRHESLH